MSSIWQAGLELMYQTAGKRCIASLPNLGLTIEFNGILDRVQVEEEDETGRRVRNDSALRIRRDIADKFYGLSMIDVKIYDDREIENEGYKQFYISEVKYVDDGEEALCLLIPEDEKDSCVW